MNIGGVGNIKKVSLLALEASSPAELSAQLTEAVEGKGARPGPVTVSLDEPKALVCPFEVEAAAARDLRQHLLSDAGEILSLTPDEIALDYQVTKADGKTVAGIYFGMPKGLFEEYLKVLDRKCFNTVRVTERFLAGVDWLHQQGKLNEQRVCFLDFSAKGLINLFIGGNGECELLRKVRYEGYEEARREIIQSLRSASAKSSAKHYDRIYYHGGLDVIESLAPSLKEVFQAVIEELAVIDRKAALTGGRGYFRFNLIRKYNFSAGQIKYIYAGVNIVIALCLMNLALVSLQFVKKNLEVSRVKDYYTADEIQYALKLKDNLEQ